tara:strand:- start:606 stop:743 length:138 start_codon:yes stop_codon:yes gene_type:complete
MSRGDKRAVLLRREPLVTSGNFHALGALYKGVFVELLTVWVLVNY